MAKKFLVAVDGSDHGTRALDLAAELAKVSDAELLILHVVPYEPMPAGLQQYAEMEGIPLQEMNARFHHGKAIGDRITGEAEARVRKNGFARVATQVAEGNPASMIVSIATSLETDMVFLGSRGLSDVAGLLIGSVSHKVMHLAPCTCVAVK